MKPKLTDMSPVLLERYNIWAGLMGEAGLAFALTCVLRTKEEQVALAMQGRTTEEAIALYTKFGYLDAARKVRELSEKMIDFDVCNFLRNEANLYPIAKGDWAKVTWTMNSKHYSSPKVGKSNAFDFVILDHGKQTWNLKVDSNKTNGPDYDEAGALAKKAGLYWGGAFGDRPHIQLPSSLM